MAVIIKEPYHCTFIHNPKTGGSSITAWLKSNFNCNTTKRQMGANVEQSKEIFGDLGWTFSTVRNPWRWAVSWYEFKLTENQERMENLNNPRYFNSHKKKHNKEYLIETQKFLELGFENWLFQSKQGPQYQNVIHCDYIMKQETLSTDFRLVQDRLNCYTELPTLVQSIKLKPWREYYTPKTVDFIAKTYIKDIKEFNYQF